MALERQGEGSALARSLARWLARPPARPLGRPGPAATPAARLSIGPRGRLRYTGRREGLGTGTYQCEPEPEFSSAAFIKALWRILDILDGVSGRGRGSEQCGGRGPQPGASHRERGDPAATEGRAAGGKVRETAAPERELSRPPREVAVEAGRRDRTLPDSGRFRRVSGPRDEPGPVAEDAGGRDITGTALLSCRRPVDSRGPALGTTPTSAGGHDEQISKPRLTPTSHTVTKANGSRRPRPCDGVQSSAKVDVSSSGSNEESKEKVFSPPTRNKTFPGSVVNCMRLCLRELLHAKGGRSSSLARA